MDCCIFVLQSCECNGTGSQGSQCDKQFGACVCREGFTGRKCDSCHFGHFNFPECRPCQCEVAGTHIDLCNAQGQCQCDEDGQCPCKVCTMPRGNVHMQGKCNVQGQCL